MPVENLRLSPSDLALATRPQRPAARPARDIETGEDFDIPVPADFRLDTGEVLPDRVIKISRFGRAGAPVVVVAGGISAGRRPCGDAGWWNDNVGPGLGVDLERFSVIGFDFSPTDNVRVSMSPRAQARLLKIALDALNIERVHAFVGASYGGMVGLAFAALAPNQIERLCVISGAHRPAALAAAWRGVQRRTVEFAIEQGRDAEGLSLARQLAMTTYRSAEEFETRFTCIQGGDGRSDLDRYLIARGEAYAQTVLARRWLSLSGSIDRVNVHPEAVQAATTLVACPTDQLVPFADMQELANRLPNCTKLHTLPSLFGHDAFLKEPQQLRPILKSFLEDANV